MIAFIWNCRGLGYAATVRILRECVYSHRPQLLFLSEVKFSSVERARKIGVSLGYSLFHFVSAVGQSGSLLLC